MDKSDCDGTGDMISAPENNQVSRQQSEKHLSLLFFYKLCLQAIENLQYTKKVVIEQQRAHFESEAPIVAPVIRIERQRLESSARKVHEYVLPLDTAWEVPRENLKFGKVSNTLQARIQYISRKKILVMASFIHRFWAWETLAKLCRQLPVVTKVKPQLLLSKCSKTIILTR